VQFEIVVKSLNQQVRRKVDAAYFLGRTIEGMTEEEIVNALREKVIATLDFEFWPLDEHGHYQNWTGPSPYGY
jgi:hypothetical protein